MRFNDLGFGFGARVLYIPFDKYDSFGIITGSGIINYSVYTFNFSYNFLRNYDFFGLSAGANVKLFVYGIPDSIYAGQSSVGIVFDIGFLTRFNFLKGYNKNEKNFSVGFTVKNLGPFVRDEPPPTSFNIGISYKPIEILIMSIDVEMLFNYSLLTYKNWNVKSGFEVYFTKYTSFIGGFVIKSNPTFSIGMNIKFDDFSVTMIYNPDFSDLFRFSVSASLKLGDFGREKKMITLTGLYVNAVRLMNTGQYSEAFDILNTILINDPTYTPAKKSLEICKKNMKLREGIDDIININNSLN